MLLKGFMRNIKPLEILTEEQVEAIHRSTLNVLENTGIKFESEKALKIFNNNGCNVDYENKISFICCRRSFAQMSQQFNYEI